MEWLNKMKERYSKKRIDGLKEVSYKRDFVDLESAKTVGMIVNVSDCSSEDLDLVMAYADALKKRNKKVLLIELNFDKKSNPKFKNSIFVNPNKLNWLDYPVPAVEKKIQQFELDILMNFDPSIRMTSKYICSISHAKTRTGVHVEGFESCYELMIGHEPPQPKGEEEEEVFEGDLRTMIKEFDYFLHMIDK